MAVYEYSISLLSLEDCPVQKSPQEFILLLKAWRKHHSFRTTCLVCQKALAFQNLPYTTCCEHFFYNSLIKSYPVQFIAIPTPGYVFALPVLKRLMRQANITTKQDFLVLPDPIYWQVASTLMYEKVMKFVLGLPMTTRTLTVQPASKEDQYYKQTLETPCNYGSVNIRACGKSTFMRKAVCGKRVILSMRGMIVPDASLKPNQIRLPAHIVKTFRIENQWIILNRMPSLQPGNFVALQVVSGWEYDCFGIPLEVVQAMNADFDGDECNLYLIPNTQSQAECATILNPESQLGCFVMQGPKLTPTQDMLVAYHVKYSDIDFLPYKHPSLVKTFRVLYDTYGSQRTFAYIDRMRQFYLDVMRNQMCFALTLKEMYALYRFGRAGSLEAFTQKAKDSRGCMVTQVMSGAKGSFEHLYQMFGAVGYQDGVDIEHCFWEGLTANEAVYHAKTATEALSKTCKIWEPGYSYSKLVHSLQGLHVDYRGYLMDGDTVIETDVLNALHFTDVMSVEGFQHLLDRTKKV